MGWYKGGEEERGMVTGLKAGDEYATPLLARGREAPPAPVLTRVYDALFERGRGALFMRSNVPVMLPLLAVP
jgi:hypothetical protein